jgi:uncharacterized protein
VALVFEWSPAKAKLNERKHGVTFAEAVTVSADILSRTIPDPDHSWDENRYVILGRSQAHRLLVVVHTEKKAGYASSVPGLHLGRSA